MKLSTKKKIQYKFDNANMIEEAFANAAFVRRVPVDAIFEVLQEFGLKV